MKIAIHAGHNPDGKKACGAVGYLRESSCARAVTEELGRLLASVAEVEDCTCNDGNNQTDVLNRINAAVKAFSPDASFSIHLNSYTLESANGCEVYVKPGSGKDAVEFGEAIMGEISAATGIKKRRVIDTSKFSVLMNAPCPAYLIECCFVSSQSDAQKFNANKIARAIFTAICKKYNLDAEKTKDPAETEGWYVITGFFAKKENADNLAAALRKDGYSVQLKKGSALIGN